jgi:hypothetical protein
VADEGNGKVVPITGNVGGTDNEKLDTVAQRTRSGKVTRAARRHDVITLKAGGYSDEEIAEILTTRYKQEGGRGISRSSVTRIVNNWLESLRTADEALVDNVRALQLHRIDQLTAALSEKALAGNLKSIDRMIRLEYLRARIAGTEAPRKLQVGGQIEHTISPEEIERERRAWAAAGRTTTDDIEGEARALPAASGNGDGDHTS